MNTRTLLWVDEYKWYMIPSLHEVPDTMLHEPIGMLPTEDEKLK